jgi:hypothetical protein
MTMSSEEQIQHVSSSQKETPLAGPVPISNFNHSSTHKMTNISVDEIQRVTLLLLGEVPSQRLDKKYHR